MNATIELFIDAIELNLQTWGFLVPIALLCCPDGTKSINLDECKQGEELNYVCGFIVQEKAHKLIIITEAWAWIAPAEMPFNLIKRMLNDETYTHQLEQDAIYQIIEITKDTTRVYTKPVYKREDEHGKIFVTFGDGLLTNDVHVDSYAPIQKVLEVIN